MYPLERFSGYLNGIALAGHAGVAGSSQRASAGKPRSRMNTGSAPAGRVQRVSATLLGGHPAVVAAGCPLLGAAAATASNSAAGRGEAAASRRDA